MKEREEEYVARTPRFLLLERNSCDAKAKACKKPQMKLTHDLFHSSSFSIGHAGVLRDSSNDADVDNVVPPTPNANALAVSEKPSSSAPSSTPKRMISRHASTPSRINGAAKSPSPDTKAQTTYDPNLARALLECSQEVQGLKLQNELLREETGGPFQLNGITIHPDSYFDFKFHVECALGSGAFGSVFKCIHLLDGEKYAVKCVTINDAFKEDGSPTRDLVSAMQEVKNLASLNHECVVRYFHCWLQSVPESSSEAKLYIQMELCEVPLASVIHNETIQRCVDEVGSFCVRRELRWFRDLTAGVEYLHSKGFIHYDLKPDNCLLTSYDSLKLADLGLSRRAVGSEATLFAGLPPKFYNNDGTALYHSPEQEDGDTCEQSLDIFALGLMFVEIFDPTHREVSLFFEVPPTWRKLPHFSCS